MEIKELATRQKLRELKEAMATGQPVKPPAQSALGNLSTQVNGHGEEGHRGREGGSRDNHGTGSRTAELHDGGQSDPHLHTSHSEPQMAGVQNNDFYAKKKSEKDPTSRWESNYSRPKTPSDLSFQEKSGNNSQQEQHEKSVDKNSSFGMDTKERKNVLSEEDMLDIQSKRVENELDRSRSRRIEPPSKDRRTYMPSEYVNGMANGESFDARKMNLSAQNFDSALNSMLGQENSKLLPDDTDYEQYARTSKYRPNPYLEPQKTVSASRSKSQRSSTETRESRSRERIKPDSENVVRLFSLIVFECLIHCLSSLTFN